MAKLIVIETGNDEVQRFQMEKDDGTRLDLIETNHDAHGWDGMQAVNEALQAMAECVGIEIAFESHRDGD